MRRALAGLWAILALAVLLLVIVALPAPERVPTHWSGARPDDWTGGATFTAVVMGVVAVASVVAALAALLRSMVPPAWARWVVAVAAATGWGGTLMYAVTVWRVGVDGPEQVREWWAMLAVLGGLVAGVIGYAVHGRRQPDVAELEALVPERSRVRAVRGSAVRPVQPWETTMTSRTLQVVGWGMLALFAVVGVVVAWTGESWVTTLVLAVTGLVAGGLALAWSVVQVHVDADGLTVRSGVVGLRLMRVPAEDVVGVDVQELDPMRWGGVGLRALPDRTAYIVGRGGPGLVVYKRDGRRLALQVTAGDEVARAGARTLLQAAGQRLGETPDS